MKINICTLSFTLLLSSPVVTLAQTKGAANKPVSNYQTLLATANGYYFAKDWKNAVTSLKKVVGDTSVSALLWQRLAYSSLMEKQYEPALNYYNKALALKPNAGLSGIIYTNVMVIFQKTQNSKEALAFVKSASDNGFTNSTLLDTMHLFDGYRNTADFKELTRKVKGNSFPCLVQPHYSDFDFWVGEWDVYATGSNNVVGSSLITKEEGGCAVLEKWTSLVSANYGNSINYYDQTKGKWEQVYIGSGSKVQLYDNGEYKDNQMHFGYRASFNGNPYTGNFIFYNQGADQVRQYQDYTTDGGNTYTVSTDLTYKRKKK